MSGGQPGEVNPALEEGEVKDGEGRRDLSGWV